MTAKSHNAFHSCTFIVTLCLIFTALSTAHPDDFTVLDAFRKGLDNSHLLQWPEVGNNPCAPKWEHISCLDDRVTSIHVAEMGLTGTLPSNFNMLTELQNVSLQRNNLHGPLPTFRGMSKLQNMFLSMNRFDSIPVDFFNGLTSVQTVSMGYNPLNPAGWTIPGDLQQASKLSVLELSECNLVGELPDFLGKLSNLVDLELAYNRLTGALPATLFQSKIQILYLNNQQGGGGLSGTIDVIRYMVGLKKVWLHGNQFTWTIPEGMEALQGLTELKLNVNKLTGRVPVGLTKLKELRLLDLSNNDLSPPLPQFSPSVQVDLRGNRKFGQ